MIHHGDCIEVMATFEPESIDAIVTDPPYGLGFMGKAWDTVGAQASRPPSAINAAPGTAEERGAYPRTGKGPKAVAFDGREWQAWCYLWAREAYRVAKPGAHLLAFGGTRTYHRLAAAIEDAGWEIRDTLVWAYASGFPKSLDVSKAIDKRPGVSRHAEFAAELRAAIAAAGYTNTFDVAEQVVGRRTGAVANWQKYQWPEAKWWPALRELLDMDPKWGAVIAEAERVKTGERDGNLLAVAPGQGEDRSGVVLDITAPATDLAREWQGWGTALKPAWEPIVLARKPLRGTVAGNVTEYGTGALNIDGCRIGIGPDDGQSWRTGEYVTNGARFGSETGTPYRKDQPAGRWPANVILTDPIFDGDTPGVVGGGRQDSPAPYVRSTAVDNWGVAGVNLPGDAAGDVQEGYGDSGTYSRFFLIPKAARTDREPVLGGTLRLGDVFRGAMPDNPKCLDCGHQRIGALGAAACECEEPRWAVVGDKQRENVHPTVKPTDLMRHLVRLVTPPGGTVLDPFLGSGTTALAAEMEGFEWVGIEREAEYVAIAEARLNGTQRGLGLAV